MAQPLTAEQLARLLAPWQQIARKADAFFQQVAERHPDQLRCQVGCDACCQQDLSLCLVEALAVLAARPDGYQPAPEPGCAFLHGGRCAIYAARPLICRTHGLAILQRETDDPAASSRLSVCQLNFTAGPPTAESLLDGTLLASALAVADGMARQALDRPPGKRWPLSQLALRGWDVL